MSDLGSSLPDAVLRDSAQALLKLLPPEVEVMRLIKLKCTAEVNLLQCVISFTDSFVL